MDTKHRILDAAMDAEIYKKIIKDWIIDIHEQSG